MTNLDRAADAAAEGDLEPEQVPYRALVLVRNLEAPVGGIDMGEFVLTPARSRLQELREELSLREKKLNDAFPKNDLFPDDWLLEKTYGTLPSCPGAAPSGLGGIPNDIEDILFLLRLFRVGDILFARQAVVTPSGRVPTQDPYRMMNALNSDSVLPTELRQDDPKRWSSFADGLRASQSWSSQWLSVARRFFLYGGAKEFNPCLGEVDRIVDYATALEAALVPETDFKKYRCANRAAQLCAGDAADHKALSELVARLYDIRSSIVHGSVLSEENRKWLKKKENRVEIEGRVRQLLIAALQKLPSSDADRKAFLQTLADVNDEKRGEFAFQMFQQIKTGEVRNATAERIANLHASIMKREGGAPGGIP